MGLFNKLNLEGTPTVDWEMTPEFTFGTFESWGGVERIRSKKERVYYFFIDAWDKKVLPKLCLMERGIKHARVVAEIKAPQELVDQCVKEQGKVALFERTHPINDEVKAWLMENVIETDDDSKIVPLEEEGGDVLGPSGLPQYTGAHSFEPQVQFSENAAELSEEDVVGLVNEFKLVDHERNSQGTYLASLVDTGDEMTVVDKVSGLMWQREGADIMSNRSMRKEIEKTNNESFAGFSDWRMPTMEEALSLMTSEMNEKGLFVHPCFSASQPFIFVNGTRKPGGYWFVDYKHGRAFYASGTIPGGFGRLCRKVK